MTYTVSPAVIEQRRQAKLRHGAQSTVHLSPLVVSMKKSLLARMGLRQRDFSWAGREVLDSYCRCKAKIVALDEWFETHPLVDGRGEVAAPMRLYLSSLNTGMRLLAELRAVVEAQAREDQRFDRALEALAAEGRKVRGANVTDE